MKCHYCDGEFIGVRKWQRWCSDKCRHAARMTLKDGKWTARTRPDISASRRALDARTLSPAAIQRTVAEMYGVPLADMLSVSRAPTLATPRFVAIYLVRTELQLSQPETGRAFGRHHTSILYAERDITNRLPMDAKLAAQVQALQRLLRGAPRQQACCSECGREYPSTNEQRGAA